MDCLQVGIYQTVPIQLVHHTFQTYEVIWVELQQYMG